MDVILETDEDREEEHEVEGEATLVQVEEDPADLAGVPGERILDKEQGRSQPRHLPEDDEAFLELLHPDETGRDAVGSVSVRLHAKRKDEFVCRSCYLIKHRSQLVDATRQVCLDCAA